MTEKLRHDNSNISLLLDIEQAVRRAETLQSLRFVIVNQTHRLISFDQAALLSVPDKGSKVRVEAISGVPVVDRTTSFVHWLERMAVREYKSPEQQLRHVIDQDKVSRTDKEEWTSLSPAHVLWIPLIAPQKGLMNILWLARHDPWTDKNIVLLDHLALSYAHSIQVFKTTRHFSALLRGFFKKPMLLLMFILLLMLMFMPVSLTAIGQAEVIPSDPFVVVSPMNGVVEKILVEPNQEVSSGQILALLDDTEHKNNVLMAEKTLQVAKAQLEKSELGAFIDKHKQEALAELKAQGALRRAEFKFAREQLNKTVLRAENDGIAVVSRPDEWAGKPVRVGERILLIADPGLIELEIMLSVKDSVLLGSGNKVLVFLDSSPLEPEEAEILHSEYEPRLTELRNLAYRVSAKFKDQNFHPRIGLRGTAKVYGQKVSLFYYLFRRPLTALRQLTGL